MTDHRMTRRIMSWALLTLLACGEPTPAGTVPTRQIVTRIAIAPSSAQVAVGATIVLSASVRDQQDSVVPGASVSWRSSSPSVASVSSGGVVTGVSAGTATIVAAAGGVSGTIPVTVVAASEFKTSVPTIALNVIAARPTASAFTLSLFSTTDRVATVTLLDDARTQTVSLAGGTARAVEWNGLAADHSYRYRITAEGVTLEGRVRTARAVGATFRFTMQADSHLDGNSDPLIYANTLANVVADSSDFLLDLGDTFMSDKFPEFQAAAPMYYAQRHYLGLIGASTPVFLVQGNHDAENGWLPANATWAAAMRRQHFAAPEVGAFYAMSGTARNYFAWTWGDATFIALDPYAFTLAKPSGSDGGWRWTLGRTQYDWLVDVLQRNRARYTFVFLHHLVGGSGAEARGGSEASAFFEWGGRNLDGTPGFATNRAGWPMPIHDLLVQYGVSAVFHGHDHLYVRQTRDGLIYQEVPQPSFARENATSSAAAYGYLTGILLGSSGHLRVTVTPERATVEYVRSRLTAGNGAVVDRYEIAPVVRP